MARARVTDFERDLDQAPGGFADELLCTDDTLSRNELQRRHPRCVLEHTGKVEGTQVHQFGQSLYGNVLSEILVHVILNFAELPNRQATTEVGLL